MMAANEDKIIIEKFLDKDGDVNKIKNESISLYGYGGTLLYADAALKADRDFVLAAVTKNGRALQYADAALKVDREIVLAAVTDNGCAQQHAGAARRLS